MKNAQVNKALIKAEQSCRDSGLRLTSKRKAILQLLLASDIPLSAYEVTDLFNKKNRQNMPAMSVYRILDFLVCENLAHKLSSTNKYLACGHIACNHSHQVPHFLICIQCHQVKEINIQDGIVDAIKDSVAATGYQFVSSKLELECLCKTCADKNIRH